MEEGTETTEKTILELMKEAEDYFKCFKDIAVKIQGMGYHFKMQSNDTAFVFRDVRESYGEFVPDPQPPRPQVAPK